MYFWHRFIAPIEGVGMLVWWIVDQVINNSDPYVPNTPWWQYTPTSLIMVVSQVRYQHHVMDTMIYELSTVHVHDIQDIMALAVSIDFNHERWHYISV